MSPSKEVVKPGKRTQPKATKKAPGAPKRFCSSYILFFMHHQKNIKDSLSEKKASEVSKRASKMWKEISAKERMYWDRMAEKEKERYVAEKEVYDGPWEVSSKRAKKDPDAPKRNPSAFLLYSLQNRRELKKENPTLQNTEISRMLGIKWSEASEEEKRPFKEQEIKAREVYKKEMAEWKAKTAIKNEEEAKVRAQNLKEKIFLAKKNKSGQKYHNFHDDNNNPQEGLQNKSSESLDNLWPEVDQIVDFAPLSDTEDRLHISRYSPDLVPPHQTIPFSRSDESQHLNWLSISDPRTNRAYQVQPLYANPNPYHPRATSSSNSQPFPRYHLPPHEKPGQVASARCFDQRFIDPGPDNCSPFGSNDDIDDSTLSLTQSMM
jgi:hypothetical protein